MGSSGIVEAPRSYEPGRSPRPGGYLLTLSLLAAGSYFVAGLAPPLTQRQVKLDYDQAALNTINLPRAASVGRISGGASAICTVTPFGRLTGCRLLSERPAACGFGETVLELSKAARVGLITHGGRLTFGRRMLIGSHFNMGPGPQVASCRDSI